MQTTSVQVAWAKFNALVIAHTTLVEGGHLLPAQEVTPNLSEAKEEFTKELFDLIAMVEDNNLEKELSEPEEKLPDPKEGGADDEGPGGCGDSDETEDGEG